jgi:GNAT superfamily N-acetyltransferase
LPVSASIRRAGPADREQIALALARAFEADPAWAHLMPDDVTRGERLLRFFRTEIGSLVPDWRLVWMAEDGSGAAVWAEPRRWRVALTRTLRETPEMQRVFGRRLPLATWTLLRNERRHQCRPEHWYLHYLGVVPESQGQGLGGRLLAPVLRRCDREDSGAYLESSTERSRALYEHHGFELRDTFPMPAAGPMLRTMWRPPAA